MKPDLDHSLEAIDGEVWGTPANGSHLIAACHALRKKKLRDFTIEDLRIMIGQNFSLKELIPIALAHLEQNLRAEGELYPGDLLHNVLRASPAYWLEHKGQWKQLYDRVEQELTSPAAPLLDKDLLQSYSSYCALFPGA